MGGRDEEDEEDSASVALGSGMFGIWTEFNAEHGVLANFFSLHSLQGLICIFLSAAQWMIGFWGFRHRREVRRVLPWHVFIGLYTYALAVATGETVLLEKLTCIQTRRNNINNNNNNNNVINVVSKHSLESMVANSLGLGLALLSGFVVLAAVSPNYQSLQTNLA